MPLGYNQSINWTKVNQLIDNSIDWDKVVALIQKVIPPSNIQKIKQSDKEKLDRFKTLVDFLFSKLSYSQANKLKYLSYWNTDNFISNLYFTWKNLPNWAKWLIGIVIFLALVGLIWGQEGLGVVFSISFFIGILFLIGWLRSH
jgi:hypothetical protein